MPWTEPRNTEVPTFLADRKFSVALLRSFNLKMIAPSDSISLMPAKDVALLPVLDTCDSFDNSWLEIVVVPLTCSRLLSSAAGPFTLVLLAFWEAAGELDVEGNVVCLNIIFILIRFIIHMVTRTLGLAFKSVLQKT
jgi:hypothetical protein